MSSADAGDRRTRGWLRCAGLLTAALCTACGGDDSGSVSDDVAESRTLFGDDRVGDALAGKLKKAPDTYAEVERLFGIGRECAREDSKEIFVVEESQTRAGGVQEATDGLMPRAVVTGCSTDPDSREDSFSLMVALFSSPDAPHAAEGDPMVLTPVEVMALDRKTGLYNFYVFETNGEGKPGTVSRIQRREDDEVVRYRQTAGKKMVTEKVPDRACNNCHANMGPLMNELTEPWSNWVSTHKLLPDSDLAGETASIVAEAGGGAGRASFANDLERIMRDAMRVWVDGTAAAPGSGFGEASLAGDQPNGLPGLLRSVFCETELNYVNAFETVPVELFFDAAAVAGGGLTPPGSDALDIFPVQMPVRSEMDKRVERFLMRKKYLSVKTMTAIRLVDEANDVFSKLRCSLYDAAVEGLPSEAAEVDAHLRAAVQQLLATGNVPSGPRAKYMAALVDSAATPAAFKKAQSDYFADVGIRYEKDTALLDTESGRTKLKKRVAARKAAARAMFPGAKTPLPILEPDKPAPAPVTGPSRAPAPKSPPSCEHHECSVGSGLAPACSACAQEVCAQDGTCCAEAWDDTCVAFAQLACGCD